MRRAGHQRIASTSAVITEPVALRPHSDPSVSVSAACELDTAPVAGAGSPAAQVLLSPEGTFFAESPAPVEERSERHRQLAISIRQRIETRLAGRIRDLVIRFEGETVVLEGKCSTYYTKQLAQHTALGILEHEQLENAIVVAVPR